MVIVIALFCFQSLLLNSAADPSGNKCPQPSGKDSSCVCQTDDGIIDLTHLSNTDNSPRYTGLKDKRGYTYSYNPCSTFQDKGDCNNVYLCQSDQYNIGGNPGNEEMWIDPDGNPFAYYGKSSKIHELRNQSSTVEQELPFDDADRIGVVNLLCDHSVSVEHTSIIMIGELSEYHYYFNLTSCQVCPGGCQSDNPTKSPEPQQSVSAGAIGIAIIVVFIFAIITYFVTGILIMKFYKKESGTNLIPHKGFWIKAPFLIKDGCVLSFGPCFRLIREKVRRHQGYRLN